MDREDLRLAVYRAFAETGRAPDASALAAQFGAEASEVVAGLSELAAGGTWRSATGARSSWLTRSRRCRAASR
jgi:hypothetical protein